MAGYPYSCVPMSRDSPSHCHIVWQGSANWGMSEGAMLRTNL